VEVSQVHRFQHESEGEFTYVNKTKDRVTVRRRGDLILDVYTMRFPNANFLIRKGRSEYRVDPVFDGSRDAQILRWKVGKTGLFVHATHTGAAYGFLIDNGFTSGGEDPHEVSR
jgi:hypothetical protein